MIVKIIQSVKAGSGILSVGTYDVDRLEGGNKEFVLSELKKEKSKFLVDVTPKVEEVAVDVPTVEVPEVEDIIPEIKSEVKLPKV